MYRILLNNNLVRDDLGRPLRFKNERDANREAEKISDNNPRYTVVVVCARYGEAKRRNIR